MHSPTFVPTYEEAVREVAVRIAAAREFSGKQDELMAEGDEGYAGLYGAARRRELAGVSAVAGAVATLYGVGEDDVLADAEEAIDRGWADAVDA